MTSPPGPRPGRPARSLPAAARFGRRTATGLAEVTDDLAALDRGGFWAVVVDFEGKATCARFTDVRDVADAVADPDADAGPDDHPGSPGEWRAPDPADWTSSMSQAQYVEAVRRARERIAAGDFYQVNLCRVLTAPLPDPARADVLALQRRLAAGNPAPYAAAVRLPEHGLHVASASPELYLRRSGAVVESGPIKGTGRTAADLLEKDRAENVMIVDLVRNDLGRVCRIGSVTVPRLCAVEPHPGLVHLVSTVRGELRPDAGWPELFAASFPPGSVTGAPKSSALRTIEELEPVPRGPYCGAVGWVDADRGEAELAVGIRTFWVEHGPAAGRADGRSVVRFGTGAGITWGSDPEREWQETRLKAARLMALASSGGAAETLPGATEGTP
ncbi:chorismate-binding protein [Allostreptomyces psammosilenae]|uniref:Para-aminobenzoate synthetase component 1 n=1 Tax=Allostreptomyces psammosilenae TaxID=1892865 RepID=A0A852ZNW0_9ACTN|nr:chorismate-binding protein [Allostreptomyces psammosilenae]NYI04083.1 para-aminobenzoate synthetase component 1 [Allostreptomyces psammosilenae]